MKTVKWMMIIVLLGAFGTINAVKSVEAVQYTTRGADKEDGKKKNSPRSSDRKKQPQSKQNALQDCSRSDVNAIKAFNRRAEKKKAEFEALFEEREAVDTPDEATEFTEAFEEIKSFYESDEFKEKEKQYERCGQTIPRPQEEMPFWLPDIGIDQSVDAI